MIYSIKIPKGNARNRAVFYYLSFIFPFATFLSTKLFANSHISSEPN